jgi:hypothetical protein
MKFSIGKFYLVFREWIFQTKIHNQPQKYFAKVKIRNFWRKKGLGKNVGT